jgi:hypothetical protein
MMLWRIVSLSILSCELALDVLLNRRAMNTARQLFDSSADTAFMLRLSRPGSRYYAPNKNIERE